MSKKLVTVTLTALIDEDSPLCDKGNIACFVHSNLLGGALEQICDLHALSSEERTDFWEETLRIKKIQKDLAQVLVGSMTVTLT